VAGAKAAVAGAKAAVAGAKAAVVKAEEAGARAEEAVLRQARADIVFAPNAGREQPINWGLPAMNSNAPSAERP
jgi:hypothetical protein